MSQTGKKNANPKKTAPSLRKMVPIGPKLTFGASEAYKLLRANLLFSSNGSSSCQIIGVTSATRGEGKTTTSLNLAYTFAETGKRVLLVDWDMRLPQVAKTLDLLKRPGLSNYLAGLTGGTAPIQESGLHENLFVMASGDVPPNPSELLGSGVAKSLFAALSKRFDYILIDLPPVNIVSDALVLSNICCGYLIVARQDYTSRHELGNCIDQLNYVNAKLLGFVVTHSTTGEKGTYKNKRYYRRYGYKYGGKSYEYGYDYSRAGNSEGGSTQKNTAAEL